MTHVREDEERRLRRSQPQSEEPSPLLRAAHPLLTLQQGAGNQAVTRTIARLTTSKTFHKRTDPGTFSVRSHRINAIEKLLKRYEKLVVEHGMGGATEAVYKDKIALLDEIEAGCGQWLLEHHEDKTDERILAVNDLRTEARQEVEGLRNGMGQGFGAQSVPGKDTRLLREKWRAHDAHTALERVKGVLDTAVPNTGSKAEIEIEVDIPIQEIGFVGMRIKLEADRPEDAKMKVRSEIALTGGVRIAELARAKIELGTYLEAQGANSTEVMRVISYGLMRVCRESPVIPHEVTNYLWGGSADALGLLKAQQFGAAIEKDHLAKNKDAYVESGFFGQGQIEGGLRGVGKGKANVMVGGGERWDANSIRSIAEQKGRWSDQKKRTLVAVLTLVQPTNDEGYESVVQTMLDNQLPVSLALVKKIAKVAAKRKWDEEQLTELVEDFAPDKDRAGLGEVTLDRDSAKQARGEHVVNFRAGAEVDFGGLGTGSLKFESHWMSQGRDTLTATAFREAKLDGKIGLKIPMHKQADPGTLIAMGVEKLMVQTTNLVQTVKAMQGKRGDVSKGGVATGNTVSALDDIALFAAQGSGKIPMDQLNTSFNASTPFKTGFSGSTTYLLGVDFKWKAKPKPDDPMPFELNLSILEEEAIKGELPGQYGRIAAKRSQRLMRLQKKHDKEWALEVLGMTTGGEAIK